jgi:hypothetical protein
MEGVVSKKATELSDQNLRKMHGRNIEYSPSGFDLVDLEETQETVLDALLKGNRKQLLEYSGIRAYLLPLRTDYNTPSVRLDGFVILAALPLVLRDAFLRQYPTVFILLNPRVKLAWAEDWERFVDSLGNAKQRAKH